MIARARSLMLAHKVMEDHVSGEPERQTIGDAEREWNRNQRKERRERLALIGPGDFGDARHHQAADHHQRGRGCR